MAGFLVVAAVPLALVAVLLDVPAEVFAAVAFVVAALVVAGFVAVRFAGLSFFASLETDSFGFSVLGAGMNASVAVFMASRTCFSASIQNCIAAPTGRPAASHIK